MQPFASAEVGPGPRHTATTTALPAPPRAQSERREPLSAAAHAELVAVTQRLTDRLAELSCGPARPEADTRPSPARPQGPSPTMTPSTLPPPMAPASEAQFPPPPQALTSRFLAGCIVRFSAAAESLAQGRAALAQLRRHPPAPQDTQAAIVAAQACMPCGTKGNAALMYLGGALCVQLLQPQHAATLMRTAPRLMPASALQEARLTMLAALASGDKRRDVTEPLQAIRMVRAYCDGIDTPGICLPPLYERFRRSSTPLQDAFLVLTMARQATRDQPVVGQLGHEAALFICSTQQRPIPTGWLSFLMTPMLFWLHEADQHDAIDAELFSRHVNVVSSLVALPQPLHERIHALFSDLAPEHTSASQVMALFTQLAQQPLAVMEVATRLPALHADTFATPDALGRALHLACIAATVTIKSSEGRA